MSTTVDQLHAAFSAVEDKVVPDYESFNLYSELYARVAKEIGEMEDLWQEVSGYNGPILADLPYRLSEAMEACADHEAIDALVRITAEALMLAGRVHDKGIEALRG